jgi:hypothetical protein
MAMAARLRPFTEYPKNAIQPEHRKQEDRKMSRGFGMTQLAILAILVAGCGKSDVTRPPGGAPSDRNDVPSVASVDPTKVAQTERPEDAVREFLEALRTGNDQKAAQLLSTAAREKTGALNRGITPPPSDTASFAIGKVELINDDGARVSCVWTDVDEDGQKTSDEAIWVVRHETAGWRVAGVAAEIFPGEPKLLLNFEDPEEMARKQQMVREEIRRRAETGMELRAETGQSPEKPVRR